MGSGADVGGKEEEMQNVGVPFLCVCAFLAFDGGKGPGFFCLESPDETKRANVKSLE